MKRLFTQMWTVPGLLLASFSPKLGGGSGQEPRGSVDMFSNPTELDLILLPLAHLLVSQSEARGLGDHCYARRWHRAGGEGRRVALQAGVQHDQ